MLRLIGESKNLQQNNNAYFVSYDRQDAKRTFVYCQYGFNIIRVY